MYVTDLPICTSNSRRRGSTRPRACTHCPTSWRRRRRAAPSPNSTAHECRWNLLAGGTNQANHCKHADKQAAKAKCEYEVWGCRGRTWDTMSLSNPMRKKRMPSNRCSSPLPSSVPADGGEQKGLLQRTTAARTPPSAPLLGSHWTERRWPRRLFRSRRTARAAPGGLRVMAAGMARTAASTQGGSRAIRM